MSDAYVQVAADDVGKKIDTSELTRADGTIVERQRIVLADGVLGGLAKIDGDGKLFIRLDEIQDVVIQLKRIVMLLQILTGEEVEESDVV